jgi:hypothetical protein
MEGSLVAYKVFTNGSVLQASEVNENLMQQAVATFSNSAARTAAITSPVEGQLTYLLDTDRFEWWSGSAWRSPFGLTQLINTNFTTASSVIIDNVFTTQFDNYKVFIKGDVVSSGNTQVVAMQFRKAGSTITASNYRQAGWFFEATGSTQAGYQGQNGGSSANVILMGAGGPTSSYSSMEFINPAVAGSQTGWTNLGFHQYGNTTAANSNKIGYFVNGAYTVNDNFDGFILTPGSGNITGNIKIYGYRN